MIFEQMQIWVFVIIFFALMLRSIAGFGDALLAMPLLTIFIDIKLATPLVTLLSLTSSSYILYQERSGLDIKNALRLILSSMIGVPFGLLLLKGPYSLLINFVLSIIIILFSIYKLADSKKVFNMKKWAIYPFGILAGFLGGACNTNAPPVIIYGSLEGWSAQKFRATFQAYLLPVLIVASLGHYSAGLWTKTLMTYFVLSFPVAIFCLIFGSKLAKNIPAEKFSKIIYYVLIVVSSFSVVKTLISNYF